MASSSKGSSFLTSHGKKYDPTFEWHSNDRLLQDPRTHAPYCHVDTNVSFFFGFFTWQNVVACFIENFIVRYYHFWNFGGIMWLIMFGMLALEHSWSVFLLWSWCNLGNVGGFWNFDNVGNLWCCWTNFSLDFGSIGIVKTLCLTYRNAFILYVGKLVGMCKLCFMNMANFCGYVHGYI